MCSILCKRITSLVIGILDMLMAGSIYSFNVYAPSMQATFNFTQEDIDTIPSFGHLGFCAGFPVGFIRYKWGSTLVASIGFVVSTTGYLLIWSAFLSKTSYHFKPWLMSFYYLVAGHGLQYLYMEALTTNIKNFPSRRRGTVVGFMGAVFGASGSIFVLVYWLAFAGSYWKSHEEKQNLAGFIILLAGCCGFVGVMSVVGLREYKYSSDRITVPVVSIPDVSEYTAPAYEYPRTNSESSIMADEQDDDFIPFVGARPRLRVVMDGHGESSNDSRLASTPDSDTASRHGEWIGGMEIWKTAQFHCLLWAAVFAGSVCFVIRTNIEFILMSFHLADYGLTCIIVIAVWNGVTRILCGIVSDKYVDSIPRTNLAIFSLIPLLVTTGFVIFYMDDVFMLILWCAAVGIAYGALWCLVPTIISETYNIKYFGIYWGCTLFVSALFSFALQRLFGYLYDLHVQPGQLFCYGVNCFQWSFLTFGLLVAVALVCMIAFTRMSQSRDQSRDQGR